MPVTPLRAPTRYCQKTMSPKHRSVVLFAGSLALLSVAWIASPPPQAPQARAPQTPQPNPTAAPPLGSSQPSRLKAIKAKDEEAPLVQLALLLDTSGSMDGLIDQARSQLWQMVLDISEARRGGVAPRLQIALFEYGNDNLSGRDHWVREVIPLTDEVDRVSEALFALTTSGGSEFCGAAIRKSLDQLEWSSDPKTLKLMFIAGNEGFEQGPVSARAAIATARSMGVTVNTIHCGSAGASDQGWKSAAQLAGGHFFNLNHNEALVQIDAPQDAEIAKLGQALNFTYIPYGSQGSSGMQRQQAQDMNSSGIGLSNMSTRVRTRASGMYHNPTWDLVDAVKGGHVNLEDLDKEALPAAMRDLPPSARREHVQAQAAKRDRINAKIRALTAQRREFMTKARAENSAGDRGIDSAILGAVRTQASKVGLTFK